MSDFDGVPLLISPKQASDIYSNSGFPKQRHVFVIRFNQAGATSSTSSAGQLTYAVKTFDRPAFQPIVEEVNQYNKKRQVYTGYKKTPIKCSFYDDAAGTAQMMWASYSRYYFGDFNISSGNPFSDDMTSDWMDNDKTDFGFTARNGAKLGGSPSAKGSQWFFNSINILHLHNNVYDYYTLVNPRIASFAPDELDYEQSGIAMINAEFVYEALIFQPNHGAGTTSSLPEFVSNSGHDFNGEADGTDANYSAGGAPTYPPTFYGPQSGGDTNYVLQQIFGGTPSYPATGIGNYSYYNTLTSGGLAAFGNFIFGVNQPGISGSRIDSGSTLAMLAASNPALAATLGIGYYSGTNPLAVAGPLSVSQSGFVGVPSQYPGVLAGVTGAMRTNFGAIGGQIATGVLAAGLINGITNNNTNDGMTLTPQAYSMMNSQNPTGSAQYGYNAGAAVPSVNSPSSALYADYNQSSDASEISGVYANLQNPTQSQPAPTLTEQIAAVKAAQPIVAGVGGSTTSPASSGETIDYSGSNYVDPDTGVSIDGFV